MHWSLNCLLMSRSYMSRRICLVVFVWYASLIHCVICTDWFTFFVNLAKKKTVRLRVGQLKKKKKKCFVRYTNKSRSKHPELQQTRKTNWEFDDCGTSIVVMSLTTIIFVKHFLIFSRLARNVYTPVLIDRKQTKRTNYDYLRTDQKRLIRMNTAHCLF